MIVFSFLYCVDCLAFVLCKDYFKSHDTCTWIIGGGGGACPPLYVCNYETYDSYRARYCRKANLFFIILVLFDINLFQIFDAGIY